MKKILEDKTVFLTCLWYLTNTFKLDVLGPYWTNTRYYVPPLSCWLITSLSRPIVIMSSLYFLWSLCRSHQMMVFAAMPLPITRSTTLRKTRLCGPAPKLRRARRKRLLKVKRDTRGEERWGDKWGGDEETREACRDENGFVSCAKAATVNSIDVGLWDTKVPGVLVERVAQYAVQ